MTRLFQNWLARRRCRHEYAVTDVTMEIVNEGAGVTVEPWVHLTCVDCAHRIKRPEVLYLGEQAAKAPRATRPTNT